MNVCETLRVALAHGTLIRLASSRLVFFTGKEAKLVQAAGTASAEARSWGGHAGWGLL